MERMNENGQIAILSNSEKTYYYYYFDESVIRVSDDYEIAYAPYWEYEILYDDLSDDDMDIEYLSDELIDFYLCEADLDDRDEISAVRENIRKYIESKE